VLVSLSACDLPEAPEWDIGTTAPLSSDTVTWIDFLPSTIDTATVEGRKVFVFDIPEDSLLYRLGRVCPPWRVLFHIEGFLTLAGRAGVVEELLRIGLGVGRNLGSVARLRADFTWEKADLDFYAPNDHFFLRFRVYQGWLRRLTTDDG
jgi:hypothetical protein